MMIKTEVYPELRELLLQPFRCAKRQHFSVSGVYAQHPPALPIVVDPAALSLPAAVFVDSNLADRDKMKERRVINVDS